MMNESIAAGVNSDQRLDEHPSDCELYDCFSSSETELDLKRREAIAVHVLLCHHCAATAQFIEETEEYLDVQLATPLTEEDHVARKRSLTMIGALSTSRDWLASPTNLLPPAKQWIKVKDFFYLEWSTVTGRFQLISGSLLLAIAASVLGYGLYHSRSSTIGGNKRPTEQLPDRTNPSSPEVAQASPATNMAPAAAPSSTRVTENKSQSRLVSRPKHGDQLLAHLDSVIDLNRSREAQYRGGGIKLQFHPTIHVSSDGLTKVSIRLPEGSTGGSYKVTLEDPYFKPLTPPATGESQDGKQLTVLLDIRGLATSQRYYLGVAREGSTPIHCQVRLKVTKKSLSPPE
jgi:hypothetical protein